MIRVPSQQDLYTLFQNEVQSRAPGLTDFAEGSNLDALGGGFSVGAQELVQFVILNFQKTFFNTANGAGVTGNLDDLENLAIDHFGARFARPGAANATATVEFTRPNLDEGNVIIPEGTVVKTDKDSNGVEQRFVTDIEQTMTGLTILSSVRAFEPGSDSNVGSGTIINIENALTDPTIVVTNALPAVGGEAALDDSQYREFIRREVETIRGATGASIQAAAENVAGVELATVLESVIDVIPYDIGTGTPIMGAEPFKLPRGIVYVADANGTASLSLINDVRDAIDSVRACGTVKEVLGASPLNITWQGSYTLNPSGPNFATLNSDPRSVEDSMREYIANLPIGVSFNRTQAREFVLSVWGQSGTGDIIDFSTSAPTGDIIVTENQKLVPDTVEII